MRTKVFAYKGFVGIHSGFKAEGLLNNPRKKDQLGWAIDARFIDVQPEALRLLKVIKRNSQGLEEIDIFETDENETVFAWVGSSPKKTINPLEVTGGSTYDADLISPVTFKTPKDFMKYIDEKFFKE